METDPQSGATSQNLAHVLDIARGTLDSEFQRANRLDEKARGQATLAGSWFAVTQAVAAIAISTNAAKGWIIGLVVGLAIQAIALVVNLAYAADVWRLREREEVGRETLEALKKRVAEPVGAFAGDMIDFYTRILDEAQLANESRGKSFEKASRWWWPVLVIGLAEIAAALLSRLA
ncbi:MAG TPA: hypothetical protein VGI76_07090 [Solirubrobacteraceae bacterium]|jgi:hypothetical protein